MIAERQELIADGASRPWTFWLENKNKNDNDKIVGWRMELFYMSLTSTPDDEFDFDYS